jgi:hypothetical protein
MAECLGDAGLADVDRVVQEDQLSTVEERREVADLRGRRFRAGVEVERFQVGLFVEVGAAQPAGHGRGLATGDLVLAEHL